jgi:hypothetical protein
LHVSYSIDNWAERIGSIDIVNSVISGGEYGVEINDGGTISVTNSIIAGATTAYFAHNAIAILPDHNLLYNVAQVGGYGPIGGGIADDPAQIIADPLFVDTTHGNFHLLSGSPAVDSGRDIGLPFDGASPDRGVFEFGLVEPADAGDMLGTAADLGTLAPGAAVVRFDHVGNNSYGSEDVDIYRFTLSQAATLALDVDAQSSGSPLDAYLRLFNSSGTQITANDDHDGHDSYLSVTLSVGTYYVGVSGYPNRYYKPTQPNSGVLSTTIGQYALSVTVTGSGQPGTFDDSVAELLARNVAYRDVWRRDMGVGVGG